MMKKIINKKMIIITSMVFLLVFVVGATLAYVFTKSTPVENTFKPSKVSCAVVENTGSAVSGATVNTGKTKENVKIQNTGNTDAYIRVAVVVNWMNEDGTKVLATKPVENTDYTITYNLSNGWFDGGDGFYYYKNVVSPNSMTSALIPKAQVREGLVGPVGTDNTQYYLSIEIVASAIQCTPASTVEQQWGVTVESSKTITK